MIDAPTPVLRCLALIAASDEALIFDVLTFSCAVLSPSQVTDTDTVAVALDTAATAVMLAHTAAMAAMLAHTAATEATALAAATATATATKRWLVHDQTMVPR